MRVWHCVESLPTRDWKVALAAVEGVHTSRRESTSPRTLGPGGPPVLGRLDRGVQTYGESTHPPTPAVRHSGVITQTNSLLQIVKVAILFKGSSLLHTGTSVC